MATTSGPTVSCPACSKKAVFSSSNPWRPFCSKQCKTIDLGAWASDQYVVPGNPLESASEDHELIDITQNPMRPV